MVFAGAGGGDSAGGGGEGGGDKVAPRGPQSLQSVPSEHK